MYLDINKCFNIIYLIFDVKFDCDIIYMVVLCVSPKFKLIPYYIMKLDKFIVAGSLVTLCQVLYRDLIQSKKLVGVI